MLRFVLGILISILAIYLSARDIDFEVFAATFSYVDMRYLALCMLCQFLSIFCRAYLWQNILSHEKQVSYRHAFESLIIGLMGNNLLPFRMGEAMRAYAMGKKESMSRTLAFASVILERLLDLFTLLLFFVVLVFVMTVSIDEWVYLSATAVTLFLAGAVLVLYVLATDRFALRTRAKQLLLKHAPTKFSDNFERIGRSFLSGIALIKSLRQAIWVVLLMVLTWTLWTAILYFGMKAFGLDLPVTAAIFVSVVVHIGVMVPSSPGFIGVFQYLCILSLAFFNVPKEIALSFSVLVHAIQYIPTTLLGLFYMAGLHVKSYSELTRELDKADS